MKTTLYLLVAALLLAGAGGCCCCCEPGCVPVDCEGYCHWLRYHGPDCREYPYSCPRCPYFDYDACQWWDVIPARSASAIGVAPVTAGGN